MLTPLSTSTDITDQGYQYIFTMSPDNAQMSYYLADYAIKKKYLHVGLLYSQDDYGQDFANNFERRTNELGIEIIDRRGYFGHEGDYQSILTAWKVLYNFDAIFLMDVLPGGAKVVNEIRKANISSPIVGSDGLGMGTEELLSIAGKNAEGLVAIVLYNPMDKRPTAIQFAENYRKKYHAEPNLESAVGYDAIMLLAYAMKQTKSSSAVDVAKYLHSLRNWPGVARDYSFAANGSLLLDEHTREKNIGKIIVHDGAVNYLDGETEVKANSEK
jgi:branched-chain amino acid transport system substrate-binding protein